MMIDKGQCIYTQYYCEENVWHLCNHIREKYREELDNCWVIFISNHYRMVPLWCQKAGKNEDYAVIWDYHVIFVHRTWDKTVVYDLDSTLEFPREINDYVKLTFRSEDDLNPQYHRLLRVVAAECFLAKFASDRSHMKKGDKWLQPPPIYDCIRTKDHVNNLHDFIIMTDREGFGTVMDMEGFCNTFAEL